LRRTPQNQIDEAEQLNMVFKIASFVLCGALLFASSSMCEAASTDPAQAGHRKSAKISPAAGPTPYGAGLNEEQSLHALELEISRKLGSNYSAVRLP